ncbi:zinc-regulated GTPase metalloprotein activator 1, partial [Salmo salar]|uniref:Zinc-regulated GTPase metalloprotein activator 1 n=1 Tax=Salmo salar TaxID=8030 RepID=A0ABM3DWD1_SALSA
MEQHNQRIAVVLNEFGEGSALEKSLAVQESCMRNGWSSGTAASAAPSSIVTVIHAKYGIQVYEWSGQDSGNAYVKNYPPNKDQAA